MSRMLFVCCVEVHRLNACSANLLWVAFHLNLRACCPQSGNRKQSQVKATGSPIECRLVSRAGFRFACRQAWLCVATERRRKNGRTLTMWITSMQPNSHHVRGTRSANGPSEEPREIKCVKLTTRNWKLPANATIVGPSSAKNIRSRDQLLVSFTTSYDAWKSARAVFCIVCARSCLRICFFLSDVRLPWNTRLLQSGARGGEKLSVHRSVFGRIEIASSNEIKFH